jgi:hypothetical protein
VGVGYRDAPAVFRRDGPAQDQRAALPCGGEFLVPGLTAVVKTNVPVSSGYRGEWPMTTSPPSARSLGHGGRLPASQPLTGTLRSNRMRASSLIPEPAMPMMRTRPKSDSA